MGNGFHLVEVENERSDLIAAIRRLPAPSRAKLIDKLDTLREPEVRLVPAHRLRALTGVVALGGDALADTEALYDGSCGS